MKRAVTLEFAGAAFFFLGGKLSLLPLSDFLSARILGYATALVFFSFPPPKSVRFFSPVFFFFFLEWVKAIFFPFFDGEIASPPPPLSQALLFSLLYEVRVAI